MIFSEGYVKIPMQSVFYPPMTTDISTDPLHSLGWQATQVVLFITPLCSVGEGDKALDLDQRRQIFP